MLEAAAARFEGPLQRHLRALPACWREPLAAVLESESTRALAAFIDGRAAAGAVIYPPRPLAALHEVTPAGVRAIILGQDPYHGAGQAHGFAFSVPPGVRPPPSLGNIFRELRRDCGCAAPLHGSLLPWARQGVLLLNAVLTVEAGRAASHAGRGWERITDGVIDVVAAGPGARAFLLWGAHAQAKRERIERAAAVPLVLLANHPSPLSARRGDRPFLGCGHFSQTNRYLEAHGLAPIDWCRAGR